MSEYTVDMDRFLKETNLAAITVVKKVGFDIYRSPVVKTPVDTGRARANWMAGMDSIPTGTTEAKDKQEIGSPPGASFAAAARSVIAGYDDLEKSLYIANNLDYINFLEQGSSDQAPNGMVAVTVAEFVAYVERAVA